MNILRKNYRKFWDQFLNLRSLFSATTYSLLLFSTASPGTTLNKTELLYLEIYNITLLYIIINMILFAKDILQPTSDHVFSNELIEIILIVVFATILIISLYLSKHNINALEISQVIIKVYAIFVIAISLFMSGKTKHVTK